MGLSMVSFKIYRDLAVIELRCASPHKYTGKKKTVRSTQQAGNTGDDDIVWLTPEN